MLFYFAIFFLLTILIVFQNSKWETPFYVFSAVMLFFIAAFRSSTIGNDYAGYIEYYDNIIDGNLVAVEPTYIVISKAVKYLFDNTIYIFILYAFLGVSLKFYAIKGLTKLTLLTVLIYFSGYFLLFEMTQIRAGVAGGLLLLCIKPIYNRKLGKFLCFAFLAFLFHFSAVVIFSLYFLNSDKLNTKAYLALVPFAYVLYFLNINLFTIINHIPIALIQAKLSSYSFYADLDNSINLFNYVHLSRCLLACVFLLKWEYLATKNKYSVILIKIYVIALFIFVAFAAIPGISSRISELLLIVEIILIPFILYLFKEKYLGLLLSILIGLAFLSFALFYTKLFTGYF